MQKLMLKLAIDYTHMGDWREHPYEQMFHEYYVLGNKFPLFAFGYELRIQYATVLFFCNKPEYVENL